MSKKFIVLVSFIVIVLIGAVALYSLRSKERQVTIEEEQYGNIAHKLLSPELCYKIYPYAFEPPSWGSEYYYYARSACSFPLLFQKKIKLCAPRS